MQKVPTIFLRSEWTPALVTEEPNPATGWFHEGEGRPTIKLNGMGCLIGSSLASEKPGVSLFARRTFKSKDKVVDAAKLSLPEYFQVAEVNEELGQLIGWEPVPGVGQFDEHPPLPDFKWHVQAWNSIAGERRPGTYELIGPKVQGGEECWFAAAVLGIAEHLLVNHRDERLWLGDRLVPRTYEGLRSWFEGWGRIEGIVWQTEDGRMCKIKARDFGVKRDVVKLPFPEGFSATRALADVYEHGLRAKP